MRLALAALVAVVAVAATACTPGTPAASPSASASATPVATASAPSATPSATPEPSEEAVAACETGGIAPGLINCLDVSMPYAGNPGEAQVMWDADYCGAGDGRYLWAPSADMVWLAVEDAGRIGRADVYDPALTTAEGIHVGSPAADVYAAYPGSAPVTSWSGTELVIVGGDHGWMTIELADGWGTEPLAVANIRVLSPDADPAFPVYGSEDFAGACPMDF